MNTRSDPDLIEVDNAFKEKRAISAPESDVQKWLQAMCVQEIEKKSLEAREIIRAITLNNLQMAKIIVNLESTITKLNQENGQVSGRVKTLTWFCAILGGLQVVIALSALCHEW